MSVVKRPVQLDQIMRLGSNLDIRREDFVLYIDNFYETPDLVYDWLEGQSYPYWKYTGGETRNSVDYNDCRIAQRMPGFGSQIEQQKIMTVLKLCQENFWQGKYRIDFIHEFNCFQTIKIFDTKLQHYPHIDSSLLDDDNCTTLNMLIYMNQGENGGTAVYNGELIPNDEAINVLYPVEERFKIERIIPAKYNRCVIFPGNRLHGAYIDDYRQFSAENNSWRYSQVLFIHPATDKMHRQVS
ncbi:hypothetical protein PUV54_00605 [Hyphococcus flavus]|uniref:Uncharacterized protein n=1 Tax=Hyphococcus flavus TaxID=1866326 RepID=A0AAE9ZEL3_9PROT|nr:hypothetical protein [Hyphococcus flavus]WDI31687.1 hypothetical protein PUV54_00605 [Hyphococcus flavus]